MKIGILTFHCAHNYGAVLQCYATQEFLKSKGHDVEIINYCPEYLLRPYRLFDKSYISRGGVKRIFKNIVQEIIIFPTRYTRWRVFQRFINHRLSLSKPFKDLSSIPDSYDVYIVGSDQIWNPKITCGFDEVYFCNFSFQKEKKRYVAYAASMESESLPVETHSFYIERLKRFDAISVREKNLQELLSPLADKSIEHVLDPTLMIPSNVWNQFITPSSRKEKYVLVYQVMPDENTLRIARDLACQLKAGIIVVGAWVSFYERSNYNDASPEEFINLVKNAACVVTTSFHGTAFSVILNRPFYTLTQGWNIRSSSLLEKLGLLDRMISPTSTPIFSEIDYSDVNVKLDILRKESQDFLTSTLTISR